jgi:5,10-methylenetetrahydromethanopterin reductase
MAAGGLRLSGSGGARGGGPLVSTARAVADGARSTEEAGFDYLGYGDTVWRDVYVSLACMALSTDRIGIGPSATNPLTRSPVATAQAIATVDELSNGRAWLGIGLGQSATAISGLPSATVDQLRQALRTIYSVFRRARDHEAWPDGIEVDDTVVALQWIKRRVPILVAAGGPKGQQVAAELADGVMLRAGDVDPKRLPGLIEQLHRWREAGPRAGDPFEVQFLLPGHITDDIEAGRRAIGPIVSSRANTSTREDQLVPEDRESFRRFRERYDYTHHASTENPVNQTLMYEVGLADYFFERYAFIGNEDALLAKLEELEDVGITATGIPAPVDAGLRVLNRYRERHPIPADAPATPLRPKPSAVS